MKTGKLIVGTVHDCNKKDLERMLKQYDRMLYLRWNPTKNNGVGCWELRRMPEKLTAVPRWQIGDQIVFDLQRVETDMVNHVMDMPCLSYRVLDRLREMDTWQQHGSFVDNLEYRENKAREKALEKNREDLRYAVKQYRRAFADLKEEARSGRLLNVLAGDW